MHRLPSRLFRIGALLLAVGLTAVDSSLHGQTAERPDDHRLRGLTEPDEPLHPEPAATDFHDTRFGVTFHVPAGWNFERKDGVLSTFRSEVRSAPAKQRVHGVATLNYNPYPPTTFAGAAFYYSVAPRSTAPDCAKQAATAPVKVRPMVRIADIPFRHGQDQHGAVCTESRDEIFTALRGRACIRFDLIVDTFCPQSSGAMELKGPPLQDVNTRLADILGSVKIETR